MHAGHHRAPVGPGQPDEGVVLADVDLDSPEVSLAPDAGGDDDRPAELGAPFPGEEPDVGPGDFYADAMETVE